MTTPPDDLEEKVDLVLENLELKEKLQQYEISQKLLEVKVYELEKELKKYQVPKQDLRVEAEQWLKEWRDNKSEYSSPSLDEIDKKQRSRLLPSIDYILSIYKDEALQEVIGYIRRVKQEKGERCMYFFVSSLKTKTAADILNGMNGSKVKVVLEEVFKREIRSADDMEGICKSYIIDK